MASFQFNSQKKISSLLFVEKGMDFYWPQSRDGLFQELVDQVFVFLRSLDKEISNRYHSLGRKSREIIRCLESVRDSFESVDKNDIDCFCFDQFSSFVCQYLDVCLDNFKKIDFFRNIPSSEKSKIILQRKKTIDEIVIQINLLKKLVEQQDNDCKPILSDHDIFSCIKSTIDEILNKNEKILREKKAHSRIWVLVCQTLGKSVEDFPMRASHRSYINLLLLQLPRPADQPLL